MTIKIIAFDWGDVLGFYDLSIFDSFLEKNNCLKNTSSFFKQYKPDFDIDKLSEEEFWSKLKKYLGFKGTWQELATANQNNLKINIKNLELAKKIKENRITILLSNMDRTSVSRINKEVNLDEYFNKYYFSFKLGQNKMNEDVLKQIISEFNVRSEEVLFIDDFQGNVDKAHKFGFKTILYKDEEQLSKELKHHLNQS